jgi:transcriptional regulator with XRE-family HTH domain
LAYGIVFEMPIPKIHRRILPDRELEIVARLKEAREFLRFTQKEFAEEIGITRQRLASYEEGRAPLRWEIALRACRRFFISEFWLAYGHIQIFSVKGDQKEIPLRAEGLWGSDKFSAGSPRGMVSLAIQPIVQTLRPGMLFSKAFDQYLLAAFRELWMSRHRAAGPFLPSDSIKYIAYALTCIIENGLLRMPLEARRRFLLNLHKVVMILFDEFTGGPRFENPDFELGSATPFEEIIEGHISKLWPDLESPAKKMLTETSLKGIVSNVKSPLKVLLERVARATAQRGKQAALAACLNVSPSRVSEWVRGVKEPGGEYTLRLLEWVSAEEAKQQNAPGGVISTTGDLTRSTDHSHEKSQTRPRKR